MLSEVDYRFSRDVLDLARRGWGGAKPNPMVGAVVVRDGRVLGRGFHAEYGGPHAESVALDDAGPESAGSTLYCSLEPCCYRAPDKHQPPCTDRIIAAGISRVVINQIDPNPRVSGRGVEILREAGIEVALIEQSEDAWRLNDSFNTAATLRRPFVHLKMAQSLDGRIATAAGRSKWITGSAAREAAHELRRGRDAVLVGVGTVNADDPRLTVRLPGHAASRRPVPVVIDPMLRMSVHSHLATERAEELILIASESAPEERREHFTSLGATVVRIQRGDDGMPVSEMLQLLWELQIRSILVEGGSRVHGYFVRSGLYDRLTAFISPRLLGASGTPTVDSLDVEELADAEPLEGIRLGTAGEDLVIDGYRRGWLEEIRQKTEQRIKEVVHVHGIS